MEVSHDKNGKWKEASQILCYVFSSILIVIELAILIHALWIGKC